MTDRSAGFFTKFRRFSWEERRALGEAMALIVIVAPLIRTLPLRVLGACLVMGISLSATGAIRRHDLVLLRNLANARQRAPDRLRS